jgi:diacylglycerol kinase family enzyme
VPHVLLIANPFASRVSESLLREVAAVLSRAGDVETLQTERQGHATELAARGADAVVAFGGDGVVNEVLNGLPEGVPLGALPGGGTNVFARALGLPNNPVEATGQILDALRAERSRTIGLGKADDRWFTFCAGLGLDADVVGAVERRRDDGRRSTGRLYVASAVREFFSADRDSPPLTLHRNGSEDVQGLSLAIVQNTSPWTYFGNRAIDPSPGASFDLGLDLFALRGLGTPTTLRHSRQLLSGRKAPHGRHVVALHDVGAMTLTSDRPTAHQVDGDYLGERTAVTFRSVPDALRVLI